MNPELSITLENYEIKIKQIKDKNQPLIREFTVLLEAENLSSKTRKCHLDNIDFFEEYLVYYEPYKSLYETDSSDVQDFLGSFFPRKAMWACRSNVTSYIATFKKFFKFLISKNYVPTQEYEDLLELIKEEKEEWLASASNEDDY